MIKKEVIDIFNFFSNIKLNEFDADIRSAILTNYMYSYKIVKEYNEYIQETRKRLFEGKDREIQELGDLRLKYRIVNDEKKLEITNKIETNFRDILDLEKDLNTFSDNILSESVDIKYKPLNRDNFVQACINAGIEITPSQLIVLDPIFE